MPSIADAIAANARKSSSQTRRSSDTAQSTTQHSPAKPINPPKLIEKNDQSGGVHSPPHNSAAPDPAKTKADQWVEAATANDDGDLERDLTPNERKALSALLAAGAGGKKASMAQVAKQIGMSDANFRRLRARPRFQRALGAVLTAQAKAYAPQIVQATIDSAMMLGRDGHQDRKLLLQLAGVLDDKGRPDGATADALKGMTSIADRLTTALTRRDAARSTQPGDDATVIEHEATD